MFRLLDWIKIGAGAALGAVLAGIVTYHIGHWKGEAFGRQAERAAALQKSMDLIRERNETNEEINSLDDGALCRELGGVWVQDLDECQ